MYSYVKDRMPNLVKRFDKVLLYLSVACCLGILFHTGYHTHYYSDTWFDKALNVLFYTFACILLIKPFSYLVSKQPKPKGFYPEIVLCLYFLSVILYRNLHSSFSIIDPAWVYVGFFAVFVVQLSKNVLFFDRFYFNPTLLFVVSFLFMILLGTLLLLLPKVTVSTPLSFVNALFMATSSVCITGLSVVDISNDFSILGQIVVITLVQLGGLGMMTFTGFFGYFFSGGFSYKNQVMYTELLGENKLGSVIGTLMRIVAVTLFFETIGAVLIYNSTASIDFDGEGERLFFAVFHSISAFCNAGFSNVPDGMHHVAIRQNYALQLIVALLFILGGLGFSIVFNAYSFIKRWLINLFFRVFYRVPYVYKAWVISFNSRLIGFTTLFLLLFSTLSLLLLEYHRAFSADATFWGKLTNAFFMGATPRSAGLNTIDMTTLSFPTVMIMLLLMWIGASPGSTGGGIKTTTFAVATLNLLSLAKGKDRLEIFKRQISQDSVRRAFAVISLSLIGLGLSVFALSITDGEKDLKALAFECFSAYNTVGLSLGITDNLSNAGRIVLALSMFVGRVGALTLLLTFVEKTRFKNYHYSQEKVLF